MTVLARLPSGRMVPIRLQAGQLATVGDLRKAVESKFGGAMSQEMQLLHQGQTLSDIHSHLQSYRVNAFATIEVKLLLRGGSDDKTAPGV